MAPPLPPPMDLGTEPPRDAPQAPRTHVWTPQQIENSGCQIHDLAAIFEGSTKARLYSFEDLALRLCIRWAGHEVPFEVGLYPLTAEKEAIAKNFGCSPPDATIREGAYLLQLVGRGSSGGVMDVLSRSSDGAFVVPPDEAPVLPWDFIQSRKLTASLQKYVKEREMQAGQWLVPPRAAPMPPRGGIPMPPSMRGAPALSYADPSGYDPDADPSGYDPDADPSGYDPDADPSGGQDLTRFAPPHMRSRLQAGHPHGAVREPMPPPRGPNGEDVYIAQHSMWVNSPARQAELAREAERAAERKAAETQLAAMQARIEAMEAAEKRDREQREAEKRAEREAAEKRDREQREAEREKRAADALAEMRRDMVEAQRKSDERFEKMMERITKPADPPKSAVPELVTSLGGLVTPVLLSLKESADRKAADDLRRHEAAEAERIRREDRERDDAKRRHEVEMKALDLREQRDADERKAREDREREERKIQREMLNRAPTADPAIVAMQEQVRALAKAVDKAVERDRKENTPASQRGMMDVLKEYNALRKALGDDDEGSDSPEVDPALAAIGQLLKDASPTAEVAIRAILDRVKLSDDRAERRELREEKRAEREEKKTGGSRRPSYIEQQDGTLLPSARARMPNNTEVDIPEDTVMMGDGSIVPLAVYPQRVAARTAAMLSAQQQMRELNAGSGYAQPPAAPSPIAPASPPFSNESTPPAAPVSPAFETPQPPAQLPAESTPAASPLVAPNLPISPTLPRGSLRAKLAGLTPVRVKTSAAATTAAPTEQFNATGDTPSGS